MKAEEFPVAAPQLEIEQRRTVPRFIFHPAFLLISLTLIGAILRFAWLDRPPIWGDEAATYMRVIGTFEQLMRELAQWGFGPLHYLMYWEIRQHTPLTPWMMRLPVAIAGTLMIPAMYFLAIQLVPRKTALLVALLTAFSAYMMNYSRDAKMYADMWLCLALHMGGFFWWLRTRKSIAWFAWLAPGMLMLGIQAVSGVLLPVELLIILTARNQYW
ncbi:MAG TPA: glycosyltransferase family 39 protein, partial [Tepidisphaeraceae bacterium]